MVILGLTASFVLDFVHLPVKAIVLCPEGEHFFLLVAFHRAQVQFRTFRASQNFIFGPLFTPAVLYAAYAGATAAYLYFVRIHILQMKQIVENYRIDPTTLGTLPKIPWVEGVTIISLLFLLLSILTLLFAVAIGILRPDGTPVFPLLGKGSWAAKLYTILPPTGYKADLIARMLLRRSFFSAAGVIFAGLLFSRGRSILYWALYGLTN